MTVNTKKTTGRRELQFASYDELLADLERLSTTASTVGNWSLGQIYQHIAMAFDASIDGVDMKFPWLMKKIFLLFMKKDKLLHAPMKPGWKIPKQGQAQFSPKADTSAEDGLAQLRAAIDRCKSDKSRAEHLAFGDLTCDEADQFNLRHAELHLSFAVPS